MDELTLYGTANFVEKTTDVSTSILFGTNDYPLKIFGKSALTDADVSNYAFSDARHLVDSDPDIVVLTQDGGKSRIILHVDANANRVVPLLKATMGCPYSHAVISFFDSEVYDNLAWKNSLIYDNDPKFVEIAGIKGGDWINLMSGPKRGDFTKHYMSKISTIILLLYSNIVTDEMETVAYICIDTENVATFRSVAGVEFLRCRNLTSICYNQNNTFLNKVIALG